MGGQPTVANEISLTSIAKGCCYERVEGPIKEKSEIINHYENSVFSFEGCDISILKVLKS